MAPSASLASDIGQNPEQNSDLQSRRLRNAVSDTLIAFDGYHGNINYLHGVPETG